MITEEDKKLLLKDLSARLPYGVKIEYDGKIYSLSRPYLNFMCINNGSGEKSPSVNECKPYLRPMSSMTEEEQKELSKLYTTKFAKMSDGGFKEFGNVEQIDYLNAHYFDYRGLIEKGLALEAPEDMYKL